MATIYFNNDAEFMNYFNSQEGKKVAKQLVRRAKASKSGVVGKSSGIEFSAADGNSRTQEEIMFDEANRLRDLIMKWIRLFLNLKSHKDGVYWGVYRTNEYWRTGKLKRSVKEVEPNFVRITQGQHEQLSIDIDFDQESIMHESILNEWYPGEYEYQYQGDVYKLIRYGWRVRKDVWFKNIPDFGYFDGFDFVDMAVKEFNSNNPYKIKVALSDAFYK